jgi:hypothetical protein
MRLQHDNLKNTNANTDGLIKCLPPTQDSFVTSPKIYENNFYPFIKYCGTRTVSSPGTASLGWRADELVPRFLLVI